MTLVGGLGTVFGPVVGAFVIIAMQNYLAAFGQWVIGDPGHDLRDLRPAVPPRHRRRAGASAAHQALIGVAPPCGSISCCDAPVFRAEPTTPLDIGSADGRIVDIDGLTSLPTPRRSMLDGRLVDRPAWSRPTSTSTSPAFSTAAARSTARWRKPSPPWRRPSGHFTEADVYERASRTLEKAILQGTTRMRTHVEVDPRIGLSELRAPLRRSKQDYAWAIDLELCVFPQEGLLNDPGCEEVMVEALELGADVVGGAPYMDTDPHGQIARIFELARRFEVDIDFHLDFDLDPSSIASRRGMPADRASIDGAAASRSATSPSSPQSPRERFAAVGRRLASAGVAVTVLPSTDLFLIGRDHDHDVPRGVAPAASAAGARRHLLARHQQRAQPLHALRRLLAHPHGQPLRECRAGRHAGRNGGLSRHGHVQPPG